MNINRTERLDRNGGSMFYDLLISFASKIKVKS